MLVLWLTSYVSFAPARLHGLVTTFHRQIHDHRRIVFGTDGLRARTVARSFR